MEDAGAAEQHVVGDRDRLRDLVAVDHGRLVGEVRAYSRQLDARGETVTLELGAGTDAGEQKQLRGAHRPSTQHHLATGAQRHTPLLAAAAAAAAAARLVHVRHAHSARRSLGAVLRIV